jgi:5-methylcytosine-specific restriction endonuclease McrA
METTYRGYIEGDRVIPIDMPDKLNGREVIITLLETKHNNMNDVNESPRPVRRKPRLGAWAGKIWVSDDFDEPLEDFEDYMF